MKTSTDTILEIGVDDVLGRISPFESEETQAPRRIVTLTPHCSCQCAKRLYKLATPVAERPRTQAMTGGYPTQSKDNSKCDYCGYYVFMAEYKPGSGK